MSSTSRHAAGRYRWTGLLATLLVALAGVGSASPAWAHGDGESEEAYLLVQQALGHLAHDPDSTGAMNALEKIDDTLAAADQEGVDIALVTDAQVALEALRIDEGRSLLQESIAEAISELKPATGEETGTTLVQSELPGRGVLTARDWGFLVVSLLLVAAGVALAAKFRPEDNLRTLRRRLGGESPSTRRKASAMMKDES